MSTILQLMVLYVVRDLQIHVLAVIKRKREQAVGVLPYEG
ncbi:hypothetical protein PEC301619_33700 [Pectobacterium carotovorum subsp. carotovorum]|nr:hypothetical protein PEC301619_33700 [Pectobacterium carotovorum subsp. carotovorum]